MNILKLNRFMPSIAASVMLSTMAISAQAIPDVQENDGGIIIFNQKFDSKTYPGITCESQVVAQASDFLNFAFSMGNSTNGRKSVVCPVVRDNTRNLDGTYSAYVRVYNPPNRSFECNLYSYDEFGGFVDMDSNSTSGSGFQTLYLDVDVSVASGYYGIWCEMAIGGSVLSYEVREHLSTDEESVSLIPAP